jgi:phosphate uptake regulator
VQITGRSTFVVSLPKRWVNKVNIKNGDSLVVIPLADGTLLLNPKLSKKEEAVHKRVIEVEPDDMEELTRKFIGAYLSGYDVIEIKVKKQLLRHMRRQIQEMVHRVIGMEIIDDAANTVTVKDLLDASDFSLLKGIKRMYSIARGMHHDAITALSKKDTVLAEDVETRDEQVDKLCWMIAKQYNLILKDVFFANKMDTTPQAALGYLLIARSLERIADHAVKIAQNAQNVRNNNATIKKITETSETVLGLLDGTLNAFYLNNFEYADEVMDKLRELEGPIENLKQKILKDKSDAITIVSLAYIVDSLERTRSYATDIAEVSINHYFVS